MALLHQRLRGGENKVGKTVDTIRCIREIIKLVLIVIDCYIDTLETIRQIDCWLDVLMDRQGA